jgi:hypothetical protein
MRRLVVVLALFWGCVDAGEVRVEFCQQRPDICDAGMPSDGGVPDAGDPPDAGDGDAGP